MPRANQTTSPTSQLTHWHIVVPFAAVVLLQIIGSLVGGSYLWGISLWSIAPRWALAAAVSIYVVITVPAVSFALYRAGETSSKALAGPIRRFSPWVGWALLAGLFTLAAWFFRSQNLTYGDGFAVVERMSRPMGELFASVHEYIRPLTVVLHGAANSLLVDSLHMSMRDAFSVISVAGGVVGLLGLAATARSLASDPIGRFVVFCVSLSGAAAMLFFGHIELYVWPTATLLWALVAAFRYLRTGRGIIVLVTLAVMLALFDAMLTPIAATVVLFPLSMRSRSRAGQFFSRTSVLTLALIGLSVTGSIVCYVADVKAVIPIVSIPENPYSALSAYHLADWLNLMLFIAPVGSLLLAVVLLRVGKKQLLSGEAQLLVVIAVACFLVGFWIDPTLGAIRDWDLLSFFGFPLSFLGGWMIVRAVADVQLRKTLTVQVIAAALFVLTPLIYDNTHLQASLIRLDPLTWDDIHYQPEYMRADRCSAWGLILHARCDRTDLAERYFRRVVETNPRSDFSWHNLGAIAFSQRKYTSAEDCFERAYLLNPRSVAYRESLIAAMAANGNLAGAGRLRELLDQEKR